MARRTGGPEQLRQPVAVGRARRAAVVCPIRRIGRLRSGGLVGALCRLGFSLVRLARMADP